jgi:hypothetical protein
MYTIVTSLIILLIIGEVKMDVKIVAGVAGGLGVILVIFVTEWSMRKDLVSSIPVRLYSNCIKMHAFLYERLLGFNGCIPIDQIDRVEIIRGMMNQQIDRNYRHILWLGAPISYLVITKDEKKRSSGLKPPGQVVAITDAIRERWKIAIIDPGQGIGEMIEYNKGIPVNRI